MKTEFIKQAKVKLSENFKEDWWLQFEFSKTNFETLPELEQEIHYQTFSTWITTAKEDIFDKLNLSILSGEYVSRNVFITDIDELKESVKNIPIFFSTPDIQEIIYEEINVKIIDVSVAAIDMYIDFYYDFHRRMNLSNKIFLFKKNDTLFYNLSEIQDLEDLEIEIFRTNLNVAWLDHFMVPGSNNFNYLNNAVQKLNKKLGYKNYSSAIRLKAKYLFSKLILRRIHENANKKIFFIENSKEKELKIEQISDSIFLKEIEYIQNHYEINKSWQTNLEDQFLSISFNKYEDMSMLQLHGAIKYYKDIRKNYAELQKIRIEVERRWDLAKAENKGFNRYCLGVCLIYVINNEFSCLLDNDEIKLEEIDNLYDKIRQYSDSTNVRNFFPQLRYLKFLVSRLEKLSNKKILLFNLSEARNNIDRCRNLMREYEINIEWCKANYNYVFQFPYENCFYKITPINDLGEIFIASSCVLPISKEKYLKEYQEYKSNIVNLENTISVIENVEAETKALEEVKRDIKNREMRSMEIIGIFTAIVTFVVSSIPSFKFIENAYQALLFMFALSTSLGIFVSLMLLITRGVENLKKSHYVFIAILGLFAVISWWYLIMNPHNIQ